MSTSKHSDEKQPDDKPSGKKTFIREEIEKKPKLTKKRCLEAALLFLALAVVFGLIAAMTFVLSRPFFEEQFGKEESAKETVTIPRDEPSEDETAEQTTGEETSMDAEAFRSSVESIVGEYLTASEEDDSDWVSNCASLLKRSLVTVTASQDGEDVFSREYTSSQETFGVILAITSQEVVILTESDLIEENAKVSVSLGNGSSCKATRKGVDATTGFAAVSVSLSELSETDQNYVQAATLGNSYLCRAGDQVAALGRPMGYTSSVGGGMISYLESQHQGVDCCFQLIQTDIAGSDDASGILLNKEGEIIGWITQKYHPEKAGNFLTAIAVSDLKEYMEKISNGEEFSCLGIRAQTVTSALSEEQNVPEGLYITKCVTDSAAYNAGMQNGDVLTEINGTQISTFSELRKMLARLEPGDLVKMTVMRSDRDGYSKQTLSVKLGSR